MRMREIDRPYRAVPLKAHVADLVMVGQVADQEDRRYAEGDKHTDTMGGDLAAADEIEACPKEHGGNRVEARVYRRE